MSAAQTATILVVDDEPIIASELAESLIDLGYDVPATAESAEEALEIAGSLRLDLVLLDIHMRGPRDGIDAAEELRAQSGVPIIYVTASADSATLERARDTQPYAYLLKPITSLELRSTVELALYRARCDRLLREQQERLTTILRSLSDAVISIDAAGKISFLNPTAEGMTGWRNERAVGRPFTEVLVLIEPVNRTRIKNLLSQSQKCGPLQLPPGTLLRQANGREVSIRDSISPLEADSGHVLGAVIVVREPREEQRVGEQAISDERSRALSNFAQGLALEIGNPLHFLIANASYALREFEAFRAQMPKLSNADPQACAGAANVSAALSDVLCASRRIRAVAGELKRLGQPLSFAETTVDVTEVLHGALRSITSELPAEVRVLSEPGTCPLVSVDPSRLSQVFSQLVLSLASVGGKTRVNREIRVVTGTDATGSATIEIGSVVADACQVGASAAAAAMPRGGGEGLPDSSLSVAHAIIASLGGRLELRSTTGGRGFRLSLPSASTRSTPVESQSATGHGSPDVCRRLLFIDDERTLLASLMRALRTAYSVDGAPSAEAALELLAAGRDYDLIVCDLMMPGLTGIDFFRILQRRFPSLAARTAFMTGGAFTSPAQQFLRFVRGRVLDKPFTNQQLATFVTTCLAKPDPLPSEAL